MKQILIKTFEITGTVFTAVLFFIAVYGIGMAVFYAFVSNI